MSQDFVVKVDQVSKKFSRSLKRSMFYGAVDVGRNAFGIKVNSSNLRDGEFWAVNNVSFEVHPGEVLGIIGLNGSGKTTLLKMINGIFWPDAGEITVKGRVGALLAAGVGFQPALTGRENIYITGAIMGMTKDEVDSKMDEIIAFADIGKFIDVPVMFYSSGMTVRLGFAGAVFTEPDVLLVDEVMAVGDINFRKKASEQLFKLRKRCTIIYISHYLMEVASICSRALWLERGKIMDVGKPSEVIARYVNHEQSAGQEPCSAIAVEKVDEIMEVRVNLCDCSQQATRTYECGTGLKALLEVLAAVDFPDVYLQLMVNDRTGLLVTVANSMSLRKDIYEGWNKFDIMLPKLRLAPGQYGLFLIIQNRDKFVNLAKIDCGQIMINEALGAVNPDSGIYREDVAWESL